MKSYLDNFAKDLMYSQSLSLGEIEGVDETEEEENELE